MAAVAAMVAAQSSMLREADHLLPTRLMPRMARVSAGNSIAVLTMKVT